MAQRPPLKNVTAALGITGILAVGLVACGGGGSSPATSGSTEAATPAASSASTGATPSTAASTAAAAAAPVDGTLTAPGTKLKAGEPAVTHTNTGKDKADPKYTEAVFTSTLTGVVAGTPDDFAKFKDAAKYAGQTPYFVSVSHRMDSLSKVSLGISEPRVTAQLKDGSDAQSLMVFGAFDQCNSTRFATTGTGDALTLVVGSTMVSCQVFLAPAGDEVTTVEYTDSKYVYANYSDNPYLKNPISWTK
ncbi:hypothetical protein J2W14_000159 [Pseudarthrobacter oxydans]|uniref:hypothetical protein n=1 Tax=Pseudarthrobacter oxydans TaxID=1671 RepID=UPI00277D7362|nr:hypothetical protein [Pseudarthrobacter oxydans]MDP9980783.1 hypothetical protein [Pseudarthrobacter oxydans]